MADILIAENDPMIRALLEILASRSGRHRVAAAVCCEELTPEKIMECPAQIALISTQCLKRAEQIRAHAPGMRLIAMTGAADRNCMVCAREAGAQSFWYQQPDERSLCDVVDRTMAGESVYPRTMTVRLGQALSTDLTDREIQVLREVVSGSTDAEIARLLGISLRTVKGHIQNLREKTGCRNRTELAVCACGCGLIVR